MNRKPVIAIDGYSSTGKSTISKMLAKKLDLIHLDTGALYRAVTFYALHHCRNAQGMLDIPKLVSCLGNIHLEFSEEENRLLLLLNGKDVSKEIRTPEVSGEVSVVAALPEIRQFLLETQQNIAEKGGVILDGRDIGTVVLPNADYKFFMTANTDVRTKRRHEELKQSGHVLDLEAVKANLLTRDRIDSERAVAPLRQATDAIVIDNSELNLEQTVALMLSYIE